MSTKSILRLPLEGVRILDLTRVLAGPYASQVLADNGANVIKVEKPGGGDDTRTWGPPFVGSQSAYFLSVNRNKRSIAVDIRKNDGQMILHELAKKSDVLIENYLPGHLKKYGLDYTKLQSINPKLIYCSVTGFGSKGPYTKRPGYDVIVQAMGGLMHITGPSDGEPAKTGVAMIDIATGLYAVGAICAALYHREKTGHGTRIQVSLLETQLAVLSHIAANYLNTGIEARRHGTAHESIVPYQAFSCKDEQYLVIAAANEQFFKELCILIGLENLLTDELYKTNKLRVKNRQNLIQMIAEKFKEKPLSEWLNLFQNAKLPYGPINNMKQVFKNEQVKACEQILEFKSKHHDKPIYVVGPAVNFDDIKKIETFRYPPPLLGEHTKTVLQEELNYTDEKIKYLSEQNIIECAD